MIDTLGCIVFLTNFVAKINIFLVKIHDKTFEPYRSQEQVVAAIDAVARQIETQYKNKGGQRPLVLLVTLSGGVFFAVELARRLSIQVELAFVKCSSYNGGLCSSGNVVMEVEPTLELTGRDVLVVEDIVDSGNTWYALHAYLADKGLQSLAIASLVLKPTVYKGALPIDFVALEVDDLFLIGYGMDYNQLGRDIDGIYALASC